MEITQEQTIRNADASAEMKGLHPTGNDIARILDCLEKKTTHDELIAMILSEAKELSS